MAKNIIRKEDSLMSDISIISVPLQFKKYEGQSFFGPSIFGFENTGSTKERDAKN